MMIAVPIYPERREELMRVAAARAKYRKYSERDDKWGKGFKYDARGNLDVKIPIQIGCLGENAVCQYLTSKGFSCSMDEGLLPDGDGDFDVIVHHDRVGDVGLQVKTRDSNIKKSLIRRKEGSRIYIFKSHIFVFAQLQSASVLLLGWMWTRDIAERPLYPSHRGPHLNIEIPDSELNSPASLIEVLNSDSLPRLETEIGKGY